jgi:hypothetical protein
MPAAAISVNPADAVDGEFFDLDLLQNPGLFAARVVDYLFVFHVFSPLVWVVAPSAGAVFSVYHISATLMPKNKTLIYV